jgi:hypothetical protein
MEMRVAVLFDDASEFAMPRPRRDDLTGQLATRFDEKRS